MKVGLIRCMQTEEMCPGTACLKKRLFVVLCGYPHKNQRGKIEKSSYP